MSKYSPPIKSSWAYNWKIPDDLGLDPRYGYQISFADDQNNTVASSVMFSAHGPSSVVPISPSITQKTTFSTSTIPASTIVATDPMSTQSVGASPLPSPADANNPIGLSKGALAGMAAALTILLAILLVGSSKLLLARKERLRQRAMEERTESPMLFWGKTPTVSRLKIPSAEPHE